MSGPPPTRPGHFIEEAGRLEPWTGSIERWRPSTATRLRDVPQLTRVCHRRHIAALQPAWRIEPEGDR